MNTKYKTPILLIEDNPADTHLVEIYMKSSSIKHELYKAESFFEGMEILGSRDIDIVLLDLSLPDISGFKTLSRYLERFPNIPVIVLTGMNNEIIGNQAIKAGAQDFLVKDQFDGKLLGRSIRYSMQRFKTQLKLEETAKNLTVSEMRYEDAQRMAKFGNWEMDIVSNAMKWTDEVFRIFSLQPKSFQPTLSEYLDYVHVEDREKVETFFENVLKNSELHQLEHRIVVAGHNLKYLSLQAKVNYDNITKKILLVGGIQDITERKLSEKLIIEKNISGKTARMKEEALTEMSFHVRTPLSSVVNLVYLLENTTATVQQHELIDGLKTSVDDLSITINNLLNFSVLASDELKVNAEEFNVNDFFKSLEKVVRIKADQSKLQLKFEIEKNLPFKLISDPKMINQIVYNLLDNSLKYTSEEGVITVKVYHSKQAETDVRLHIDVLDTGKGMKPAQVTELLDAEKLLEIYTDDQEVKKKRQLGIAIVSKLCKSLTGHLRIESEEGKGSAFKVMLPVKLPKQVRHRISEKPETPIKILLVEDHFLNQIATKKVLTGWSDLVSVDIAENGLIGVEKHREHEYDLILMDIQMPVMNGLDSATKIREQSSVPIIALTANASKQEQDRAFEVGMNDYLAKPFKPQDLQRKIMAALTTATV
ncbi:MAG: response regulator [Saprospiraceae bacterium]